MTGVIKMSNLHKRLDQAKKKKKIKKLMSQRANFTKSHFTKSHYGSGGKVIHTNPAKKAVTEDPLQRDVEREITKLRISFIAADAVFIGIIFYIIFRN